MGVWVTVTMLWAEVRTQGWIKWDWAFKTIMFSAFVPLVIRSRTQIEAFAQTYVFSLAANFVPFGLKVMISGGGYGRNLGLENGNANLAEGGHLSTACLMAIPVALFLGRNTQLLPRSRWVMLGYVGLAGLALLTALGTYERSALVGLVALGLYMFMRSRNKLLFGLCLAGVGLAVVYASSSAWTSRIDTVAHPMEEDSGADAHPDLEMDVGLYRDASVGWRLHGVVDEPHRVSEWPGCVWPCLPQHLFRGAGRARCGRPGAVPGVGMLGVRLPAQPGAPDARHSASRLVCGHV